MKPRFLKHIVFSSISMGFTIKWIFIVVVIVAELSVIETTKDFISKYKRYNTLCRELGYERKTSGSSDNEIIAFYAQLSADQWNLHANAVVVFGRMILNSGSAYDANTGIFTAPKKGTYVFTWTMLSAQGKHFHTTVVLNGMVMGYNFVDGRTGNSHNASGTSSAIIKMKKNDKVWIRTYNRFGEFAYKTWASFSGYRL